MNELLRATSCEPGMVTNWFDFLRTCPFDPRDLIAQAILNETVGKFELSTNYIVPGEWSVSPLSISSKPIVTALESNNQLKVADAAQWNFLNLTWNNSPSLAIPIRKVVFLRGINDWSNQLYLDFGENPITEVQLSFLMNAATRGDNQGTVPVIRWTGLNLTGDNTLSVVVRQLGIFSIGIWTYDGAEHAMFETIWNVVR